MPTYRKECPSYPISIFIEGSVWETETICRDYCDEVGFCVTITDTTYCHTRDKSRVLL